MTHFATADDLADSFFDEQLELFRAWALPLAEHHPDALLHAANSAAVLRDPAGASFDMVRPGVALYGMDPFGSDAGVRGLEPALELVSWVGEAKRCEPGQSVGYGREFVAGEATVVGTVPIGYGDGWRRSLGGRSDALVAGRRRPLVGRVSMDNLALDLGPDAEGDLGAEVVLLGRRGDESISAEQVAAEVGTINYEVTCALGARVERRHHRDGKPTAEGAA